MDGTFSNKAKSLDELKKIVAQDLAEVLAGTQRQASQKEKTDAAIDWMREHRCMSILSPRTLGGLEASISETCNLIALVSGLSGSLGLIYSMHLSQALSLTRHFHGSTYLENYVEEMSSEQHLIASATSEKGAGGDIFGSVCKIHREEDGLSVSKEVPNISYVDLADALLVTANHHEIERKQSLVLVRKQESKVDAGFTGSFMGMKGIYNASYSINAKFPEAAVFKDDFPVIARTTMTAGTQLMWAAVWSGIAHSALEKARIYIRKELKNAGDTRKQMNIVLSSLKNKQYIMNAIVADAVREFESAGTNVVGLQTSANLNRLKIVCSTLVNEICVGCLGICGLRGYSEGGPYSLSQEIGDALSGPLMVSNYRLLANNAEIENFVDESLNLD